MCKQIVNFSHFVYLFLVTLQTEEKIEFSFDS